MSHIVTRRLSVKRKYSPDVSDQTRISDAQLSKVMEGFILSSNRLASLIKLS